jgi:methyltransferase
LAGGQQTEARTDVTRVAYIVLCGLVGVERLLEVVWSRAHERRNAARGGQLVPEPAFGAMALLHVATLVGAPLEAWLRSSPPPVWVGAPALVTLGGATALRVWALTSLGDAWSVRVTRFPDGARPVVSRGPYRHVRHPNYLAVILELLALPLAGGAWITAISASVANALILARRIPLEERELAKSKTYRLEMGDKPRFWPARRPAGGRA